MKQRVNASLETDAANAYLNSTAGLVSTAAINGSCSAINGKTVTNKPSGVLCLAGTQTITVETSVGWGWKCQGVNKGTSEYCNVIRYVQLSATSIAPAVTNTTTIIPVETVSTAVNSVTAEPIKTTLQTTNDEAVAVIKTTDNKAVGATAESTAASTYDVTAMIAPIVENDTVVMDKDQAQINAQIESQINGGQNFAADSLQETSTVQPSQIIMPSVVIRAKDLAQNNNPKITGTIDVSLKVENVTMSAKEDGSNMLALAGKSQPNAVVTVYIFSSDPTVITIKADANGNWSYELDKELADGQHEAYVAVTDSSGKIITKSQPIAFVKTAQTASMIPMSQLTANQSPIERSSQQYILIAIAIMSVFLAIALGLIGFLSYKRNLDEEIY